MPLLSRPVSHLNFHPKLKLPTHLNLIFLRKLKFIIACLRSLTLFRSIRNGTRIYLPRTTPSSICLPELVRKLPIHDLPHASAKDDFAFPIYPSPKARKKALLIACTYAKCPTDGWHLPNSWKDTKRLKTFLLGNGWKEEDIVVLVDQGDNKDNYPTLDNILKQMVALVDGACAGDSLFMHFSGHGGQTDALEDEFEADGKDELIWPCDWHERDGKTDKDGLPIWTCILDDTFRAILVDKLPIGCRLLGLIDCCSSGTMFDLPNETLFEDDLDSFSPGLSRLPILCQPTPTINVSGPSDPHPRPYEGIPRNPPPTRCNFRSPRRGMTHPPITKPRPNRKRTYDQLGIRRYPPVSQFRRFLPRRDLHTRGEKQNDIDAHNTEARKKKAIDTRIILGDVMCIASCADSAQAYETEEGGTLVQAFCKVMETQSITLEELYTSLKTHLELQHKTARETQAGFDQASKAPIPQVTFSRLYVDKDAIFQFP